MKARCRLLAMLLAAVVCGTLALAQQPSAPQPTQSETSGQVQQPPERTAPAAELEKYADLLKNRKEYAEAVDYYELAMRKQPSAVTANKMGIADLQMQHWPEAHKSFQKAIKIDKQYADAYNNLGVIYYLQKKYSKAIKYYDKALKLREDSASFHSNLGTAYFAEKKLDQAIAEYNRAMALDPDVFERRSETGVAAQMSSPENRAHFYFVLARMYAKGGNLDRSLEYLRKAIEDGYKQINDVYQESEFATLRKDPRFNELMASRPVSIPQ